jgi:DNA-directed RNA polymerase specialized sigma subunit
MSDKIAALLANLPTASTPAARVSPSAAFDHIRAGVEGKQAMAGLPRPQDLLKLPKADGLKMPAAPKPPALPRVKQPPRPLAPKPAGIKPVTSLPRNMGATPMTPMRPTAPMKLAEEDAELEGYEDVDAMSDEELYDRCEREGLVGPKGTEYDSEKQAYVQADSVKITFNPQKEKDVELWREYMRNPSSTTLSPLMRALQPVINSEVNRWAGNVPRPVLEMEAKKLTLDAIKTYDPNKGTALSTHVHNRLYKLSRTVYSNQDIVRMPENKKLKSQTFYNGVQFLQGEFGREPSQAEIADHLGWNQKTVRDVQRSMVDEYVESQDEGASGFDAIRDEPDPLLDYVYHSLTPLDQKIFEQSTGYNGQKAQTAGQVAKNLGIQQNQVAYRRRLIAKRVEDARNTMG